MGTIRHGETLIQAGMGASLGVSKHDMGTSQTWGTLTQAGTEPHGRGEVLSYEKPVAHSLQINKQSLWGIEDKSIHIVQILRLLANH